MSAFVGSGACITTVKLSFPWRAVFGRNRAQALDFFGSYGRRRDSRSTLSLRVHVGCNLKWICHSSWQGDRRARNGAACSSNTRIRSAEGHAFPARIGMSTQKRQRSSLILDYDRNNDHCHRQHQSQNVGQRTTLRKRGKPRSSTRRKERLIKVVTDSDARRALEPVSFSSTQDPRAAANVADYDAFVVRGMFSKYLCDLLIARAERTEWNRDEEFLDGDDLWQHDVYALDEHRKQILMNKPQFSSLILPQLFTSLNMLIQSAFTNPSGSEPQHHLISHVFLRKYSQETRPGLLLHTDDSTFTLSVQLSQPRTSFDGGHLELYDSHSSATLARHQPEGGFRDTCQVSRSTSESCLTPPVLLRVDQGDAVLHKSNLFHRVVPVTHGARFSVLVFAEAPSLVEQHRKDAQEMEELI
mmetsp:Transcript_11207/g.24083  ORF Transcript_11207/g.24083 Transcript_11207/m.24083 type:complete len:414 (+) Transcript_11207:43-1284(+)